MKKVFFLFGLFFVTLGFSVEATSEILTRQVIERLIDGEDPSILATSGESEIYLNPEALIVGDQDVFLEDGEGRLYQIPFPRVQDSTAWIPPVMIVATKFNTGCHLQEPPIIQVRCWNCNHSVSTSDNYCRNCGAAQ